MIEIERVPTALFDANCYIVSSPDSDSILVVDPGVGAKEAVAATGRKVGAVLLTHGHPDHTWDAHAVSHMGGEAPVFMPSPDRYWLDDPVGLLGFGTFGQWDRPTVLDAPLGDWEVLPGLFLRMVPAPGHSPGSALFLVGGKTNQGDAVAFSADVIFEGSVGRTDLLGGDEEEMKASLRLLADALDPKTVLLPGHGGKTTWVHELNHNHFVAEARKQ